MTAMGTADFGTVEGHVVPLLAISSPGGLTATVTPWGARLVSLHIPDRQGKLADVVLGHDRIEDYLAYPTYFGATCGRYANRIAGGRFLLDGTLVQLDRNEGPNTLHGGREGFDRKLWSITANTPEEVSFAASSADGEMGFPGHATLKATYRFTRDDRLEIVLEADTDRPTVMNMVNHAYFNLAGHDAGSVLGHEMRVAGDFYTPVTADLLATGEIRRVEGTAFDFRQKRRLAEALLADPSMTAGYDHNWCLSGEPAGHKLHLCAEVIDPVSGRGLRLATNQPGVQIYTCGQMNAPVPAKGRGSYGRFAGLTLETQYFPCSPNNLQFPQARLDPGQRYHHAMEFSFFTA